MLCEACRALFRGEITPSDTINLRGGIHQPSVAAVIEASDNGCRICFELVSNLKVQARYNGGFISHEPSIYGLYISASTRKPKLNLYCFGEDSSIVARISYTLESDKRLLNDPAYEADGGTADFDKSKFSSTSSPETWSLILSWVNKCVAEHNDCDPHGDEMTVPWYPTRLVRIHGDIGGANGSFNIHDTRSQATSGKYATLSHCWGGGSPNRLLTRNLTQLQMGAKLSELPKVYAQALQMTFKLGLQYIWIDSLCIIQDSHSDWAEESLQMGLVYKHSFLNIAASGAPNASVGCYFSRPTDLLQPLQITSSWTFPAGAQPTLPSGPVIGVNSSIWEGLGSAPLNTRGWALQERVLSRRQIHFTPTQVFFECRSSAHCESFVDGMPQEFPPYGRSAEDKLNVLKIFGAMLQESQDNKSMSENMLVRLHDSWNMVVQEYTNMSLTYSTDKMAAIAGLAAEMAKATGSRCLAGLWEDQIHVNLVWAPNDFVFRNVRPRPRRAPSWSWMSIDHMVTIYPKLFNSQPRSQIKFGRLIDTMMIPPDENDRDIICKDELKWAGRLYPARFTEHNTRALFPSLKIGDVEYSIGVRLDEEGESDPQTNGLIALLILISPGRDNKMAANGLLLKVLAGSPRKARYERIARFIYPDHDQWHRPWHRPNDTEHEEALDDGLLVITLV